MLHFIQFLRWWECHRIFIETQCRMKIAVFEGVTLVQNFRYKGAFLWTIFNVAKLGELISLCYKNTGRNFFRFVTFTRLTDGRTNGQTFRSWLCLHSYSAVKYWPDKFIYYLLFIISTEKVNCPAFVFLSVCLLATNYRSPSYRGFGLGQILLSTSTGATSL